MRATSQSSCEPRALSISAKHLVAALGLSIAGAVIALLLAGSGTQWSLLLEIPWTVILLLFGMVILAWICNGLRTWLLARTLGHHLPLRRSIAITLSSEFAIAATPAGVGGFLTRVALQKKQGIPVADTSAMIATDLVADGVFFLLILPFGIKRLAEVFADLSGRLPFSPVWLLVAAILVVLLGIGSWLLSRFHSSRKKLKPSGLPAPHLLNLVGRIQKWFWDTRNQLRVTFFRRPGVFLLVCLVAAVQWSCRYGTLVVILAGLGKSVEPILLMLIQGSLFLLGIWVSLPGGGGAVEILSACALVPLVGVSTAGVAVVVWRFFTFYLYLISGGAAFFLELTRARTPRQEDPDTAEVPLPTSAT